MGTHPIIPHSNASDWVAVVTNGTTKDASRLLQYIFTSFIRNPATGLEADFGWPRWEPNSTSLALLFGNNEARISMAEGGDYGDLCKSSADSLG
jgi:hypothetical protein